MTASQNDVLQDICTTTLEHIAREKQKTPLKEIQALAQMASPVRGFIAALQKRIADGGTGFITEIKKASPSAGIIRPNFTPAAIAQSYEAAGAACLSVLTEGPYFQGKPDDLIAAREACALPVLRKDFMLDTWQVVEARAMGADCILLIMAAIDDALALDLHAAATELGMDVLIESHDRAELDRALRLPSGLIGINNRNLKTLVTDLAMTEELSAAIPADRILVSESGIKDARDIARLRQAKAHCFLVGESLLKQSDPGAALKTLTAS